MDSQPNPEDPKEKLLRQTREQYETFSHLVTIREDDSWWMATGRVLLRIFGIALMILLSPFLFIGLFIAFIAVF